MDWTSSGSLHFSGLMVDGRKTAEERRRYACIPTHPEYDASFAAWLRARDVIAGEDGGKSAGEMK
jgi:hypothetical protein